VIETMSGFATLQGRNYAIKRAESKRWSYENSGGWARAGGVLAPPSVRRSVATGTVGAAGLLDFPHVAGVGAVGGVLLRMAGVLVRRCVCLGVFECIADGHGRVGVDDAQRLLQVLLGLVRQGCTNERHTHRATQYEHTISSTFEDESKWLTDERGGRRLQVPACTWPAGVAAVHSPCSTLVLGVGESSSSAWEDLFCTIRRPPPTLAAHGQDRSREAHATREARQRCCFLRTEQARAWGGLSVD